MCRSRTPHPKTERGGDACLRQALSTFSGRVPVIALASTPGGSMPQKTFDKSSKWLVEHHGNAILYLGGMPNPRRWRARPAEVVQPARLPDGLLEVIPPGQKKPDYCLVEIATYPEKRILQQALDDLALTYLH